MNKISRNLVARDSIISLGFYYSLEIENEYLGEDYQLQLDNIFIETIDEDECVYNNRRINVTILSCESEIEYAKLIATMPASDDITDPNHDSLNISDSMKCGIYIYEDGWEDDDPYIDLSNSSKVTFSIFRNAAKDEVTVIFFLQ